MSEEPQLSDERIAELWAKDYPAGPPIPPGAFLFARAVIAADRALRAEPVAWIGAASGFLSKSKKLRHSAIEPIIPLYAHPPAPIFPHGWLDEEAFDAVMYAYRCAQPDAAHAFETVKEFIRKQLAAAPKPWEGE